MTETSVTPDIFIQIGGSPVVHYGIDLGRGHLAALCGATGRSYRKVDADAASCDRCPRPAVTP